MQHRVFIKEVFFDLFSLKIASVIEEVVLGSHVGGGIEVGLGVRHICVGGVIEVYVFSNEVLAVGSGIAAPV